MTFGNNGTFVVVVVVISNFVGLVSRFFFPKWIMAEVDVLL